MISTYNYNVLMYNVDHKEEGHDGTMSSLKLALTRCERGDQHEMSSYTEYSFVSSCARIEHILPTGAHAQCAGLHT